MVLSEDTCGELTKHIDTPELTEDETGEEQVTGVDAFHETAERGAARWRRRRGGLVIAEMQADGMEDEYGQNESREK